MTSSVQSHLPSKRCLYERQCPEQEHRFHEDAGVVAGGEGSVRSHACARPLDVSALTESDGDVAPSHAVLSVEASARVRIGRVCLLNHAHACAEAIVTRAEGSHRTHVRTKSHSAPESGSGLLGSAQLPRAQLSLQLQSLLQGPANGGAAGQPQLA